MLEAARIRLEGHANVTFHQAEMNALPLPNNSVDLALISLVLHHVESPAEVVIEAARVLRPGGRLVIIDMVQHDRSEYRDTMGHLHLGFTTTIVQSWTAAAELDKSCVSLLRPDPEAQGPGLFAATAPQTIEQALRRVDSHVECRCGAPHFREQLHKIQIGAGTSHGIESCLHKILPV